MKREEQKQKRQANSKGVDESTPPSKRQKVAADNTALVRTANTDRVDDQALHDLAVELDEDSKDESDSDSDDLNPETNSNGPEEQTAADDVSQDTSVQDALTGEAVLPMPDEEILEERCAVYLETAQRQKLTQPWKTQKGKASAREPGPKLLDMVNAQRRKLMCRRIPVKLAFNSDRAGECYLPNMEQLHAHVWRRT